MPEEPPSIEPDILELIQHPLRQLEGPSSLVWLLYLVSGALAVLGVLLLMRRYRLRSKIMEPADQSAIAKLKALGQDSPSETFAAALDSILRTYLQRRLKSNATAQTSSQILEDLKVHSPAPSPDLLQSLERILRRCHATLFAGSELGELERKNLIEGGHQLIQQFESTFKPDPASTQTEPSASESI